MEGRLPPPLPLPLGTPPPTSAGLGSQSLGWAGKGEGTAMGRGWHEPEPGFLHLLAGVTAPMDCGPWPNSKPLSSSLRQSLDPLG